MPAIRIRDLADVMIQELAPAFGRSPESIEVQISGHKPGEKMYEELMNIEETRRSWELARYFVILPAFADIYREIDFDYPALKSKHVTRAYQSADEDPLSKTRLATFLRENHLLRPNDGDR
jgi:FlaA1/EpsC-like NDP-sugar epimerase